MGDRLMLMSHNLRVTSVNIGGYGGYIFSGKPVSGKFNKTLVCKAPYHLCTRSPVPGEIWEITGQQIKHDEFNTYIDLTDCSLLSVEDNASEDLLKWHLLKHPKFRGFGLGKRKIEILLSGIGTDALLGILNKGKWEHLADLVNDHIAKSLCRSWSDLKNDFETFQFLKEHGIPLSISRRLLKVCSYNTVARLKANPYSLVAFNDIVPNIWPLLDGVAFKLGIDIEDNRRLIGLVEHYLYTRLTRGHSSSKRDELVKALMLHLETEKMAIRAMQAALSKRAVCHVMNKGVKYYQLASIGYVEFDVEKSLNGLLNTPPQNDMFADVDYAVEAFKKHIYKRDGYYLTPIQLTAIKESVTNRFVIIDGYGGTGKTTILEGVVSIAAHEACYVLALAGKAKERAKESIGSGAEAYTIHTFIEKLKKHSISLEGKIRIIIDEASMVDILLMYRLLRALRGSDYSLLLVGDKGQLSPVGVGLCFHRLVDSNNNLLKAIKLREVHRTKATGTLHLTAMDVRKGRLPDLQVWNGESEGVYLLPCDNQRELFHQLLQAKLKLPNAQIVTAHVTESRQDSAKLINNYIQGNLQPGYSNFMSLGELKIMSNDWVIVTQNMYDMDLYNGNTGKVSSVYYSENDQEVCCDVLFGNRLVRITKSNAWQLGLQLAYAISTHKSQGSEYDCTIVCAIENSGLLDRSMFYTAITRSKKLTLVAGKFKVALKAVQSGNRFEKLEVMFDV